MQPKNIGTSDLVPAGPVCWRSGSASVCHRVAELKSQRPGVSRVRPRVGTALGLGGLSANDVIALDHGSYAHPWVAVFYAALDADDLARRAN